VRPTTTESTATAAAVLTAAALLGACGSDAPAASPAAETEVSTTSDASAGTDDRPTDVCPIDGVGWEVAKLYIEHNATDEDTGVHGFFGGEAWSVLCLRDPNGTEMLLADPLERFDRLGISDLFFESREPPNDDYPMAQAFADFPAGAYLVSGIDHEGLARVGTATFTHDIPAAPVITDPSLVTDPDEVEPPTVPATGLVVAWEPVITTIDDRAVEITGYEVIVTDEEAEHPDGWARPVYDVHVPADQRSLTVPDEWLRTDTLYELEVLAIEASGNQTISVGFFRTD
jgi:hypothetical protein